MKKLSWKEFTLLGLVLIVTSAITSAMHKEAFNRSLSKSLNGSLTASDEMGRVTCTPSLPDVNGCDASTEDKDSNTSVNPVTHDSNLTVSGNNGNTSSEL